MLLNGSRIKPKVALLKPVSAAISIGPAAQSFAGGGGGDAPVDRHDFSKGFNESSQ
jgi:hypothetical protein